MTQGELSRAVECVLFVAEGPVGLDDLCDATEADAASVETALGELGRRLIETSGLRLIRIAGGYQICTHESFADTVARYLKPQRRRLSRAALEALAIIAYKQPLTAQEIQIIRGVQSEYAIRVLLDRGLIEEVDRKHAPGRPILYGTTQEFLHQFKISDVGELPKIGEQLTLEEVN
jgi:segregation and condensation protein B